MRFATAKQIVAIALLWAGVLFAAGYITKPHPLAPGTSTPVLLSAPAGFRVEVSGGAHYHLIADLVHAPSKPLALHFPWLDSVAVNQNQLIAYVRYNETADVSEFADALAQNGVAVSMIRVDAQPEPDQYSPPQ
ncbi:MAG TPA: hypothetical protein VKU62_00505 [Thermoanaerobaculia bacterium]|nr:hypothetical protein [Thermoanaerobaculia bacterium]